MAKVPMAPADMSREMGGLLINTRLNGGGLTPRVNPTVPQGQNVTGTVGGAGAAGAPAGTPTAAPSIAPTYADPLAGFDPNAIAGIIGNYQSSLQAGGDFTPMDIDTSGDAGFEALLRARMNGEGVAPSMEDVTTNVLNPYYASAERNAMRSADIAVETMISRGILDSSEAGRAISDIAIELADNKNAFLGQIGMQLEAMRQEGINAAINSFGILEGNKLQAKTTITAANIGAAAQIKASAIGAGATVAAAGISAQARLQEAGLNAQVAMVSLQKQMDMSLVEAGIDPVAFQNDPEYRGSVFEYYEMLRHEELALMQMLNDGQWANTYGQPRP